MEAFLLGGGKQSVAENLFRRILGQFEIVDARVDGRVAAIGRVYLADDGQTRLKVGEATRWKRGTAGCELKKCLTLVSVHSNQHVYKSLEARTINSRNNSSR